MLVYLNDEYVDRAQATVSIDDRGFLFGDGVYEVLRATDGRLSGAPLHWARLDRGLAGLSIDAPAAAGGALAGVIDRLLAENGHAHGHALVYIQVTRGAPSPRTHHFPPAGTAPTVFVGTSPFTLPETLRATGASCITTADLRWARCDLKTVNLLPNVMAKQQAVQAGAFEAILVRDGVVTEGASTNVFAVVDGVVRTHPATERILPGVRRTVVLEAAHALGVPVHEAPLLADALPDVTELFITSTTNDVMPVVRVDGHPVGDGTPGPIARALFERMQTLL